MVGKWSLKPLAVVGVNELKLGEVVGKWSLVALAVVGVNELRLGEVFPALQIDYNTLQQQLVT